jgi:repressor LexA
MGGDKRMKKLSIRQEKILEFITDFFEDQGYPPTVRDIQHGCDISSTSVVDYNLNILQRERFIRRSPDISRGLELLNTPKKTSKTIQIPVIGYIAAGQPLPNFSSGNVEDPLETVELSTDRIGYETSIYALRVKGTSMIDALIADGDIVIVKPTSSVNNGDTIVARLIEENEATLKRFYDEGGSIRLQPANSQMAPIYVAHKNLDIQGKVVAIVRDFD